ncbi:protein-L-isoaspartate(D-aspartate) O-methyltransferase [Limimonas halophila]|uniref:Protein-L-isoaspartate O-methyltransferase n=1 Tax=Limimonas halophila TaxID=1082479 RepID=A0A1G7PR49_9PROT|nr:protein-L-isoaspartate(D-aspartate) O-methyltransferase [Limimonas halophila]SDF88683.1 protein-L-isoaspartate(D-aspartate) O-methyltransferase [Limimonas halophila]
MRRAIRFGVLAAVAAMLAPTARAEGVEDAGEARRAMVRIIETKVSHTASVTNVPQIDPRVMTAMRAVPRHVFVPGPLRPYAYAPTPLPVTAEQRLASPFLVALMTHLAEVQPGERVFETGTGAGYHAAVLAEMGAEVVSVEVLEDVAEQARANLKAAGIDGIETHVADGYYGWARGAPYDAIILKEAVGAVPRALLDQLAPGGKLVAPIGPETGGQQLTVITKNGAGGTSRREILPVQFTPLQGGERI